MAEKVTIQFNSIADNGQGQDVLLAGSPFQLFASIDNIDALGQLHGLPVDENVFVYIRNVLPNDSTRKQSAFYMHDYKTNHWQEVLLGTHSHENKEILDQLGNIDVENLPFGENKILSISRIDEDGSPASYAYKLEWKDRPKDLPEIPNDMLDRPVYLSVEDGNYVWKDKIIPAQTFQYKQVKVTEDDLSHTLIIKDLLYDPSEDTLLVFDRGQLLFDFKTEPYSDEFTHGVIIEAVEGTFEPDEVITVLVLKNGVKGFIDTIASEYLTKAEAVEILGGKGISLNNYVTKDEFNEKADKQHTHTQFSKLGHNHDERYAMFYHSHDGIYLRQHEVYTIIADVLNGLIQKDDGGNIIIDEKAFELFIKDSLKEIETGLKNYILQELDQKIIQSTKDEINSLLEDFNTDQIKVVTAGNTEQTLTDYLKEIQNKLNNAESTSSKIKFDTPITVNIGEGNSIGGFNDGDIITKDITLQEFTTKLLTNRVKPILKNPELNIKIESIYDNIRHTEKYEPGDVNVVFRVTPEFIQNDAGLLNDITIKIISYKDGTDEIEKETDEVSFMYDEFYEFQHDIYDGKSFDVIITASYNRGQIHYDNLKNTYVIESGQISKSQTIEGTRKSFIGKTTKNYRQAKAIETPKESFVMEVKGYQDLHDIILAFPTKDDVTIQNIFYKNQGCDVTNLFDESTVQISGANNYKPIDYDVYHLYCPGDLDDTLYFEIKIGRDKLYGEF